MQTLIEATGTLEGYFRPGHIAREITDIAAQREIHQIPSARVEHQPDPHVQGISDE